MQNTAIDDLKPQYPEITAWLTKHDKNIEIGHYNWNNAIQYVLDRIEENGHYELPAMHSQSGSRVTYTP